MKTKLDTFCEIVGEPTITPVIELGRIIINAGFRKKSWKAAYVAFRIAHEHQPLTLRGLFYGVVSAGAYPSTDKKYYDRLGKIVTRLRRAEILPYEWLIDNMRSTQKPSSWTGLNDFVDTVRQAYRKDFWNALPGCVHILCEKDAIAGTVSPVTAEYDVALSPIRGYCSLTYVNEIATLWNRIDKPIHAYYIGDFDPSGFDLERDLRDKLSEFCDADFQWTRLGVTAEDFDEFDLLPLAVKATDSRSKTFIAQHGSKCAEIDAVPANELRQRIRDAIESHIDTTEWNRLAEIEQREKSQFDKVFGQLREVAQ